VQSPGPPILVGGESDGALRRVARFGQGWFGWNMTPDELAVRLERLDHHLARHDFVDGTRRTRDDIVVQVGLRFGGPADELATLVDGYGRAGAARVAVARPMPSAEFEAHLAELAAALGVERTPAGATAPRAR
jgi:hypothetical protein